MNLLTPLQPVIVIEVAGKPIAKGRGKIGKIGDRAMIFTPKKTRDNENMIKMLAGRAMGTRPPLTGAVAVTVIALVGIPSGLSKKKAAEALQGLIWPITRPDIDNYIKSALDGCNGIVFVDDNQVANLHAYKKYSDRPRLRIEVRAL